MDLKCRLCAVVFLVSLSLSSGFADENKVGAYNIGAAAGFVTGYGLSYRQWFGKNGAQVTLAPFYSSDSMETNFTMSVGAIGLRMLKEARFVNLFAYYGAHFWYSNDKRREYSGPVLVTNDYQYSYTKDKLLFIGGGPGLDIHFWKLSFNVMFGLAYRSDLAGSNGINFTGETGLYYSF